MLKHMERLSFLHKVSHVHMIQDCKNGSMKTSIHSLCRLFHKLRFDPIYQGKKLFILNFSPEFTSRKPKRTV